MRSTSRRRPWVAERGVYGAEASELVNWPIFKGLTDAERAGMFDWVGDEGEIKPWLREGITWQVGDASDPDLVTALGQQDLVVASNFLCHMAAPRRGGVCGIWPSSCAPVDIFSSPASILTFAPRSRSSLAGSRSRT